jgi:hypothetical protein
MKKLVFCLSLISLLCFEKAAAQPVGSRVMKVNYKSIVSRADLNYTAPVKRSEEGIPVGNGRTGSLLWTTPNAMHFQINRVDVFSIGCYSNSFPIAHSDYSNGCGYVDINIGDYDNEIFTTPSFNQHLSVFDGLATVKGKGIDSRVIAWNDGDVIATEINDQRSTRQSVNIDLRMLRYVSTYLGNSRFDMFNQHTVQVRTGSHTATSRLEIRNGRIILIQEFKEDNFYDASAVAIGVAGRNSKANFFNESTVRLSVEPGAGKYIVLTASAGSMDPKADVAALALKQLDAAAEKGFDALLESNSKWWSAYWSKAFVRLHSADSIADNVEKNYTYLLYIMASCSRGDYMPRFSGMLWLTNGDMCMWGSQYWWHNQGTYFNGLTATNRPEIMEPVFLTYSRNIESFSKAAVQQWGTKGVWIPETSFFDGLEDLPDSVAREMRDLYLAKKPWAERSKAFQNYARYKNSLTSRWNWLFMEKTDEGPIARKENTRYTPKPPFAYTVHVMSSTAKISYLYWLRYAYYLDKEWLKNIGYPMIKGTAEFYSNFPNLYKGKDGKYHIRYINNLEDYDKWGGEDTAEELSAMYAMLPIAIRASEILGVDADRRPVWKEILNNLAPVPNAQIPAEYYDLCTIGTDNKELFNKVMADYKRRNPNGANEKTGVSLLSRNAVTASNLGLGDQVKFLIPNQMRVNASAGGRSNVFPNRLSTGEGPGAIECERLGLASQALNAAMLQSVPPSAEKEPINYIFPAWPKEWDGQFTLAARNAFTISASKEKGAIEFVEIYSQKGGPCQVKNPWPGTEVTLYRDGKKANNIAGELLVITSKAGETISLVPKGKKLVVKEIN